MWSTLNKVTLRTAVSNASRRQLLHDFVSPIRLDLKRLLSRHRFTTGFLHDVRTMSSSVGQYQIIVKTGDRKQAGTDANIRIVLYDDKTSKKTQPAKLDNRFRDDFERGQIDKFNIKDPVDIHNISRIELWRDKHGISPNWFVDTIQVKNKQSSESFIFPIYRWIKDTVHYQIIHLDTFLPQNDPHPDQRQMEIDDKRKTYILTQKVPGLVAQVRFL